jgi:hypothetical protein
MDRYAEGGNAEAGVSGVSITVSSNVTTISLEAGNAGRTEGILTAGGTDPTITQGAASGSKLSIAANTTINLGGTTAAAGGTIILVAAQNPPVLDLTISSKILLGAGQGGSNIGGVTTVTIGDKAVTSADFVAADYKVVGSGTLNLVQLGGTTAGTITADTSGGDVPIASNSVVIGSAE